MTDAAGGRAGRLEGKVALITGGGSGIGAATGGLVCAEGGMAMLVDADAEAVASTAKAIAAQVVGAQVATFVADVADAGEAARAVERALDGFGRLDVLVNNASMRNYSAIADASPAEWQAVVSVNLVGAANLTYCAVRHMPYGSHIVNVSSRGAFRGEPAGVAYGASKAGLNAMGQSLAIALAPLGIAVATVAPGFVETDMSNEHLKTERGAEIRAQSPYNRVATPEEIADAIVWLASPEARWATGAILDLNGASYLRT